MTERERLRREVARLHEQRERGDLTARRFEQLVARPALELCRATVRERLLPGESVLAEHHVVLAHMRLTRSVLRESDQESLSLFATEHRLLRLRSLLVAGRPPSCDEHDRTVVDEVPYERIRRLAVRRQVRPGEALAGAAILALALLFRSTLQITGAALALLGALGVLHALLLPTRWLEVEVDGEAGEPLRIPAMRHRSARRLVRRLRAAVRLPRS